jgi:hypothetical protein
MIQDTRAGTAVRYTERKSNSPFFMPPRNAFHSVDGIPSTAHLAVGEVRYLDTIPVYVAQGAFSPRRNSDCIFRFQGLVKSAHVRSLR